jgi:hypothetical protein
VFFWKENKKKLTHFLEEKNEKRGKCFEFLKIKKYKRERSNQI